MPDQITPDEYDFQMREQHDGQGRWISPDPTRGLGNKYAYADNNPLSKIDLLGLLPIMQCGNCLSLDIIDGDDTGVNLGLGLNESGPASEGFLPGGAFFDPNMADFNDGSMLTSMQQVAQYEAQQQVTATASGNSVTYTYSDGSTIVMKGTHPFRDNNPGNEIAGPGVIGKDKSFVIFATAEDGWNALSANLQGHLDDSILATITARTPQDNGTDPMLKGNDPVKYANAVAGSIGVPASTKLSALTSAQFTQLVVSVAQQEGYNAPGNTMSYTAPQ